MSMDQNCSVQSKTRFQTQPFKTQESFFALADPESHLNTWLTYLGKDWFFLLKVDKNPLDKTCKSNSHKDNQDSIQQSLSRGSCK